MTPAELEAIITELEAIIAELEAGFLAECECDDCWGHGTDGYVKTCAYCDGIGLDLQKEDGKRAAEGIRARLTGEAVTPNRALPDMWMRRFARNRRAGRGADAKVTK